MLGYFSQKGYWFKVIAQDNGEQQLPSTRGLAFDYIMINNFRADRASNGRLVSTIKRGRIATHEDIKVDDIVEIKLPAAIKSIKGLVIGVEHQVDKFNPSKMVAYCDIELRGE